MIKIVALNLGTYGPKLQFDYRKVADSIRDSFVLPEFQGVERSTLYTLVQSGAAASNAISNSADFERIFANKENTWQTQIEMYAQLVGFTCNFINNVLSQTGNKEGKNAEAYTNLENKIRAAFATQAMSTVCPTDDGRPLFERYLTEQVGKQKPTVDLITQTINKYFTMLGVNNYDEIQKYGRMLIPQILRNKDVFFPGSGSK